MKIELRLFVFTVFLFASIFAEAQTLAQLVKAGDEKFKEADYYNASLYYREALKKNNDNPELNYKLAESYRLFNDYANAAEAYGNVVKTDKAYKYPLAVFWLGEMLRSSCVCKNEEALKQLKKFKNKYHKKDYYNAKAQQEIEACVWVATHQTINDSIQIEHLGKDVNTENSEFNAIPVYPDKIQFSSLRNISGDKKNENYLVRLYNQSPAPQKIYMPEGADAGLNIGNGAYSPDSKRFYFTQCEQKDKISTRCDIYLSRYENYKWQPAEKLANVNDSTATNTQPALGRDLRGNEVLFFSSDRKGGQGGLDIWYSTINKDGSYSKPVNLGKQINTPGNEITSFYDTHNNKLYFSSDWHYGFGGYDIFETTGEYTQWTEPLNLMQPINSAQNDLYYTITVDNSRAYLTSNRVGSYYIKAETCCNDIYAYNTGKKIYKPIDTVVTAVKDTAPAVAKTEASLMKTDTIPVAAEMPQKAPEIVINKLERLRQILPVLYFDNDQPDCCNLRDTTALDYKQTYEAYTALRYQYEKEFSKGLTVPQKTAAEKEVSDFFSQKVDGGFYELIAFSSQLLDLLKGGSKLEVTIKGYCSPLNYSAYNIKLGYRRVASLENYLYHYRGGALMPYINNGSLTLKRVSFGKEKAPEGISDKLSDLRNSVYNPSAALERRVEVIEVELK